MIRLVIAEDQALVAGALARLLGLEPDITVVATVGNGDAALEAVRTLRPEVLVADIEMPLRTGIEVAARLREEALPTQVLIVTTFDRPGYLRRAMSAGVSGYLLKDSPVDVLVDAVRRVAAGQRVLEPQLGAAAWSAPPDLLSDRERDVLRLAEEGQSNKEIARRLQLSPGTVRNYLSVAANKLGASNRIEAGRIARKNGWL